MRNVVTCGCFSCSFKSGLSELHLTQAHSKRATFLFPFWCNEGQCACSPCLMSPELRGAPLADAGVWDVDNVLEATFARGDFEPHTLSIEVEDVPGVLNQASLPYSKVPCTPGSNTAIPSVCALKG